MHVPGFSLPVPLRIVAREVRTPTSQPIARDTLWMQGTTALNGAQARSGTTRFTEPARPYRRVARIAAHGMGGVGACRARITSSLPGTAGLRVGPLAARPHNAKVPTRHPSRNQDQKSRGNERRPSELAGQAMYVVTQYHGFWKPIV